MKTPEHFAQLLREATEDPLAHWGEGICALKYINGQLAVGLAKCHPSPSFDIRVNTLFLSWDGQFDEAHIDLVLQASLLNCDGTPYSKKQRRARAAELLAASERFDPLA